MYRKLIANDIKNSNLITVTITAFVLLAALALYPSAKVADIDDYIEQTYGSTIAALQIASYAPIATTALLAICRSYFKGFNKSRIANPACQQTCSKC